MTTPEEKTPTVEEALAARKVDEMRAAKITALATNLEKKYDLTDEQNKTPPFDSNSLFQISRHVLESAQNVEGQDPDQLEHDVQLTAEKILDVLGCIEHITASEKYQTNQGILLLGRACTAVLADPYFKNPSFMSPQQGAFQDIHLLSPLQAFFTNEVNTQYSKLKSSAPV